MKFLKQFIVAFSVFLVVDLLWLGVIAKNFYTDQLGDLMTDSVIWPSALVFYVLFVIGLIYFALEPGLKAKSLNLSLKKGALYGFFTYMTYELTNYAVIANWPAELILVDIVWGVVLASLVSVVSYKFLSNKR